MHDRLSLPFTQCLNAVHYPLIRIFVNVGRREFRLADAYRRCHNKHCFCAERVRLLLVGRKIGKSKNEFRKRHSEDSASKEVAAEQKS